MVLCFRPPKLFWGPVSMLTVLAGEDMALWAGEASSPRPSWASLGVLLEGQVTFSLLPDHAPHFFPPVVSGHARGDLKGTEGRVCFPFGAKGPEMPPPTPLT